MVLIIVNVIVSLAMLIGGFCMRRVADVPGDHTIGFRTARAMADDDAWSFANKRCGMYWLIIGAAGASLTAAAIFCAGNAAHFALLVAQTAAMFISAMVTEMQLDKRS